jgi:hypothetical protein
LRIEQGIGATKKNYKECSRADRQLEPDAFHVPALLSLINACRYKDWGGCAHVMLSEPVDCFASS